MNRFHAKKPESKTHQSKKTAPKTAADTSKPGGVQPPDSAKDADGTTSMGDILHQRQAQDNSRDEAGDE